MAEQEEIKYVTDFAQSPGPRYIIQGENSGEQFFNEALKDWFDHAIHDGKKLVVVLDGTNGYLISFLDESFGRLVYYYGLDFVKRNLKIISDVEPEWLKMLYEKSFVEWEDRRNKNQAPRITKTCS